MFKKTARFYDVIYSYKDYQAESVRVATLIGERSPNARTLLDVACGTGMHLKHLISHFDAHGLDADPEMLAIARERVPDVPLHEADMADFDLRRRFDAVTCLFSSIGYTKTVERLDRAVRCMAAHLNEGGVLIVEPWITPEAWIPGSPHMLTIDEPDLKLARIAVGEPIERGRLVLEYLIGTPGRVERLREEHELGWFTHEEYLSAFGNAGLTVEHDEHGLTGRGLYIGTRG